MDDGFMGFGYVGLSFGKSLLRQWGGSGFRIVDCTVQELGGPKI